MENELQTEETTAAWKPPVPAIYVRSAMNDIGQLEERLEDARELARMNGLDVAAADTVAEYGSGADIVGRPGLRSLLEMAGRGEISHLVTLQTSHLSRDCHDLHQVLVTLQDAGVIVVTSHGTHKPGMEWDLTMQTLIAMQSSFKIRRAARSEKS